MRLQGLVIGAALSIMAFGAQAAPITYQFTAEIFSVTDDIGLFDAVKTRDVVTGQFAIDPSDTASAIFSDSSLYFSPNAFVLATVEGITMSKKGSLIQVTNDSPVSYDSFDLSGYGAGDAGTGLGYRYSSVGVYFTNATNTETFTSLSIPAHLSLSDFEGHRDFAGFSFSGFLSETDFDKRDGFTAHITSLERVAPVPLPAGLPLLAAGVGLFGLVGWRRQRVSGS